MMERAPRMETTNGSLANQTWFAEFLGRRGFRRTEPGSFSNGRASVRVEKMVLIGDPGTGDTTWTCQLHRANRASIERFLDQTLSLEPFWSEEQLARERIKRHGLVRALAGIHAVMRENPESRAAVELRGFLSSLQTGRNTTNLANLAASLNSEQAEWAAKVFAGVFVGKVPPDDIICFLADTGEPGTASANTPTQWATDRVGPGREQDSDRKGESLSQSLAGPVGSRGIPST